ncbi:MAG: heavy metal translocating P-type ATPase, partial [Thermoguttaceae bacterium]|nr:heavy metal translocating P-type ATPase [Thermoguttaceae bacterium]
MSTAKSRFRVEGMHCAGCVANLERRLRGLPGVENVAVSLPLKQADVIYDDSRLTINDFLTAIGQAGFSGTLDQARQTLPPLPDSSEEESQLKRRLILSMVFLVPLLVLTMGSMARIPGLDRLCDKEFALAFASVQFVLSFLIAVVNRKYFTLGFRLLLTASPNMDSLVALGASTALVYSTILFATMMFQTSSEQECSIGVMDLYFESAATILTLITLGRYLECRSRKKTTKALAELVQLAPDTATVIRDGIETVVPNEQVLPGDIVVIRPGKKIPVDGHVVEGESSIDQSALTGESIPIAVVPGDRVLAATINQGGWFKMSADKVGRDTTLARMIELIRETAASKAPLARIADRACALFVPLVIALALLTLIVWLLVGQTLATALTMMISVLVVSCPCALGLATPLAVLVGTGAGAKRGILVKSAAVFELLNKIDTIVLDKT